MATDAVRRNSGTMVAATAIRLAAGTTASLAGAVLVQMLIGVQTSPMLFVLFGAAALVRLALVTADWWMTTYSLTPTAIEYRVGRVSTAMVTVDYRDVRGVQRDAPWVLRVLGRTELRLECSATDMSEIRFAALTPTAADAIIGRISGAHTPTHGDITLDVDDEANPASRARRMPVGLYVVARGRYALAVPLALSGLGLVAQSHDVDYFSALAIVWGAADAMPPAALAAVLAALVIVILLLGIGGRWLSVANLRQVLDDDALETRQGVFSTQSRTLSMVDATVVQVREPLIYRLCGRVMLFVSGGSGKGDPPLDLAPSVASRDATHVVATMLPGYGPATMMVARTSMLHVALVALTWAGLVAASGLVVGLADPHWAAVTVIIAAASGIPLVARSRVIVRAGDGGEHLEFERGLVARHRWIVPAASTLSYMTERGLLGGALPTNRVRIVCADRGARGISAWGLSATDLAAVRALLESRSTIGTYDFRRDRVTAVDP